MQTDSRKGPTSTGQLDDNQDDLGRDASDTEGKAGKRHPQAGAPPPKRKLGTEAPVPARPDP